MNELEARKYAEQLAQRWPDHLQVEIDRFADRADGHGYTLRLTMPRENRILHLRRGGQFQGICEICALLLGEPAKIKRKPMQQTSDAVNTAPIIEETPTRTKRPYHRKPSPPEPRDQLTQALVEASPVIASPTVGEAQILQELITHAFEIPGIIGLGRFSEMPRTWKLDVTTVRGPETYRVTRNIDGSFQQERW